jgi:aminoglycoside phosphotransferase (APT) family kinase protein
VSFMANLTPETVCDALLGAGVICSREDVEIIARDERWAVPLPGERIAWFPASQAGNNRLSTERRVLSLLSQRCSFALPRPLYVSPSGFEVRQMVSGRCDPWGLFHRCQADSRLALRIGRSVGAMLAEQHSRIGEAEVARWLPQRTVWPETGDWIRERLPQVVNDSALICAMEELIECYEAVEVCANDRVLVHGDVGLHNLAVDPESDAVNGIFDYDSAAWADRHHDFRYLPFDVEREDMLDAALEVYEPAVGRAVNRDRIRLYNAACAVSFLAFRVGIHPEQKSAGRTLAEDVRWVRTALTKLAR